MTYEVALLTFGVILLLLGLIGRVKAKEIDVGTSSAMARLTVGIIGVVLVVLSFDPVGVTSKIASQFGKGEQAAVAPTPTSVPAPTPLPTLASTPGSERAGRSARAEDLAGSVVLTG